MKYRQGMLNPMELAAPQSYISKKKEKKREGGERRYMVYSQFLIIRYIMQVYNQINASKG